MKCLNHRCLLRDATRVRPGLRIAGMALGQQASFMGLLVLGFMVGLTQAAWADPFLQGQVISIALETANVTNDTGLQTVPSGPLTLSNSAVQGGASSFGTETVNYGVITANAGGSYNGTIGGGASGNTSGIWNDTFSVVSSTLATGDAVTLSGMLTLDVVASESGDPGISAHGGNALADLVVLGSSIPGGLLAFNITLDHTNGTFNLFAPVTIHTFVGDTLFITERLNLDPSFGNGNGFTSFDASHTSIFTLASATAGADFTTASGTSYLPHSSTVPEPATLFLLGSALVGLAAWRRKQAA